MLLLAVPQPSAWTSAHVETAELGSISATFAFQVAPNSFGGESTSGLMLSISRSGTVVYSAPVRSHWCEGSEPELEGKPECEGPDVHVATPEPGQEREVALDVYTGGGLRWSDVTVPKGLDVDDQRLEGHGFTIADGIVLEGRVTDLATGQPIAARVRLERIEPRSTGGYGYEAAALAASDARGRWVLKHAPAGWHRVVVEADGFVPRVAGYARFEAISSGGAAFSSARLRDRFERPWSARLTRIRRAYAVGFSMPLTRGHFEATLNSVSWTRSSASWRSPTIR